MEPVKRFFCMMLWAGPPDSLIASPNLIGGLVPGFELLEHLFTRSVSYVHRKKAGNPKNGCPALVCLSVKRTALRKGNCSP